MPPLPNKPIGQTGTLGVIQGAESGYIRNMKARHQMPHTMKKQITIEVTELNANKFEGREGFWPIPLGYTQITRKGDEILPLDLVEAECEVTYFDLPYYETATTYQVELTDEELQLDDEDLIERVEEIWSESVDEEIEDNYITVKTYLDAPIWFEEVEDDDEDEAA